MAIDREFRRPLQIRLVDKTRWRRCEGAYGNKRCIDWAIAIVSDERGGAAVCASCIARSIEQQFGLARTEPKAPYGDHSSIATRSRCPMQAGFDFGDGPQPERYACSACDYDRMVADLRWATWPIDIIAEFERADAPRMWLAADGELVVYTRTGETRAIARVDFQDVVARGITTPSLRFDWNPNTGASKGDRHLSILRNDVGWRFEYQNRPVVWGTDYVIWKPTWASTTAAGRSIIGGYENVAVGSRGDAIALRTDEDATCDIGHGEEISGCHEGAKIRILSHGNERTGCYTHLWKLVREALPEPALPEHDQIHTRLLETESCEHGQHGICRTCCGEADGRLCYRCWPARQDETLRSLIPQKVLNDLRERNVRYGELDRSGKLALALYSGETVVERHELDIDAIYEEAERRWHTPFHEFDWSVPTRDGHAGMRLDAVNLWIGFWRDAVPA